MDDAQPMFQNDVEGYLAYERDKTIKEAISATSKEVGWHNEYQATLLQEWESTRRSLLSTMGVQGGHGVVQPIEEGDSLLNRSEAPRDYFGSLTSDRPRTRMDERAAAYSRIVSTIVQQPEDAAAVVLEFERNAQQDKSAELHDAWRLLAAMVTSATKGPGDKGQAAIRSKYVQGSPELDAALADGVLAFLQGQYGTLVEAELARQPNVAKQGGVPGADSTVRGYLNIIFAHGDYKSHLVDGVHGWAYVYYMLRCGWIEQARTFVDKNKEKFGKFQMLFSKYCNGQRRLPSQDWEEACREFNLFRLQEKDPYKLIVWNLVSRCDVHELRAYRGLIQSTQDFIWYKLMLVSYGNVPETLQAQELHLHQIQQQLFTLGPSHFSSGRSPLAYLFVLLSVQLFEQAIAFMYSSTPYPVEAIHMAISLYYCGLLRVPSTASEIPVELLSMHQDKVTFNFPRLILDYATRLVASNPIEALNYCALLQGDTAALILCISDLVVVSGELDVFLDNNRQEGLVSKLFPSHLQDIRLDVAQRCQAQGKIEEAVKLFDLAGQPEAALQLLVRQLSKLLAVQSADKHRIVRVARDMHQRLNPSQLFALQTPPLIVAFDQLLSLDTFFDKVTTNQTSEALLYMSTLNLIPFTPEQIQPCTTAFHRLHETVKRLFPEILSTTMQLLTYQHSLLSQTPHVPFDISRAERDKNIRTAAKAIVTFSGTIQYQIPKDLTAQLLSSELVIRS